MPEDLFDLRGRSVLITGATSGIGLHLTGMLLERGARVVAAARTAETSAPLRELGSRFGTALTPVAMDVADAASTRDALDHLFAGGVVDVLVNNAGIPSEQPFLAGDTDEWHRTIEANLAGPVRLSSAVAAHLVDRGAPGSIINVLSIAAFRAIRNVGAYSVSKAGLGQATRSMALEFAAHGIRVNAIVPGYIETPMNQEYLAGRGGERTLARVPMGRIGSPADLDGAVVFLASDASSYVTGACLAVDGGFLL
jgi:NAD(P)-dependent dehydrogenase (short-subunit alcohol dehydrogenase family)